GADVESGHGLQRRSLSGGDHVEGDVGAAAGAGDVREQPALLDDRYGLAALLGGELLLGGDGGRTVLDDLRFGTAGRGLGAAENQDDEEGEGAHGGSIVGLGHAESSA